MNNQEITSSKPDYSWLLLGLTALVFACLLSCCASKKKVLNLQKSETVQQSEVKKDLTDSVSDKSKSTYSKQTTISGDYSEVIEESADSTKIDKEGNTTVYKPVRKETRTGSKKSDRKSEATKQKDIKSVSSLKLDSAGKSHTEEKSKIENKEVKESNSLKTFAFAALLIAVAITWIIYQVRKKRSIG